MKVQILTRCSENSTTGNIICHLAKPINHTNQKGELLTKHLNMNRSFSPTASFI